MIELRDKLLSLRTPFPYDVKYYLCAFNQDSEESIVEGFKGEITHAEALTGKKLCCLLEIDYEVIVEARKADQNENVEFFTEELVKDAWIRELIKNKIEPS